MDKHNMLDNENGFIETPAVDHAAWRALTDPHAVYDLRGTFFDEDDIEFSQTAFVIDRPIHEILVDV